MTRLRENCAIFHRWACATCSLLESLILGKGIKALMRSQSLAKDLWTVSPELAHFPYHGEGSSQLSCRGDPLGRASLDHTNALGCIWFFFFLNSQV